MECVSEPVTQILDAVSAGNEHAAEHLLPLVYDELRHLAAPRMVHAARANPATHRAGPRGLAAPGRAAAAALWKAALTSLPPPRRPCGRSLSSAPGARAP